MWSKGTNSLTMPSCGADFCGFARVRIDKVDVSRNGPAFANVDFHIPTTKAPIKIAMHGPKAHIDALVAAAGRSEKMRMVRTKHGIEIPYDVDGRTNRVLLRLTDERLAEIVAFDD